jgi:hypothetical protein
MSYLEQVENPIIGSYNFGTKIYCSISRNGDMSYEPFRDSNGTDYSTFERMRTDYFNSKINFGTVLQNIHIKTDSCSSIPYTSCCKCDKIVDSPYAVLHDEHHLCYKCFESFVMDIGKICQLDKNKSIYLTFWEWTQYSCPAKNCKHNHIRLRNDVVLYHCLSEHSKSKHITIHTSEGVYKNVLKHGFKHKKYIPCKEEKDKWRQNRCSSHRRK